MKILQASPLAGTFLEGLRSAEKCSEVKVCASSCVRGGTALHSPGRLRVSLIRLQPWEGPWLFYNSLKGHLFWNPFRIAN